MDNFQAERISADCNFLLEGGILTDIHQMTALTGYLSITIKLNHKLIFHLTLIALH